MPVIITFKVVNAIHGFQAGLLAGKSQNGFFELLAIAIFHHEHGFIFMACGLPVLIILLLGLAYKKNVDDDRESVTFKVMELLTKQGAQVEYNDPYIPVIKPRRQYKQFVGKKSVTLENIDQYDMVVVLTDHSAYDYAKIVEQSKVVVDTRNACGKIKSNKIIKA